MNDDPQADHGARECDLSRVRRQCDHPYATDAKGHLKVYRREFQGEIRRLGPVKVGILVSLSMMGCYVSQCPNQWLIVLDSLKQFASEIACQAATVRRHIEELEGLGYVRVLWRPPRGNQGPWILVIHRRMQRIAIPGEDHGRNSCSTRPIREGDSSEDRSRQGQESTLSTSQAKAPERIDVSESGTHKKNGSDGSTLEFETEQGFEDYLDYDIGFALLPEDIRAQEMAKAKAAGYWARAVVKGPRSNRNGSA